MLPAPALLLIGLALGFLVLLPARRLQLAGFRGRSLGIYAAGLWALAFFVAIRPVAGRFMVPILLIAYLAPFVVAPGRLARIVARGRGRGGRSGGGAGRPGGDLSRPPVKNVTPPEGPPGSA
jgi:hypothetical protein